MNLAPIRDSMRRSAPWLGAGLITFAASALLLLVHADASAASIAYLVLVIWFATIAARGISLGLAVLCAVQFDYFFLEPRFTFSLSGFQSWLSMASFVVACVIVSRVAERARRQTRQANQRREDVERLYALNQELMLQGDSSDLVHEIPRLVAHNFALEAVGLYIRDEDEVYSSAPLDDSTVQAALRAVPVGLDLDSGLLEGYTTMNLVFGMNSVGAIAWRPANLSREVSASIAAQVAIVITRAHAIEASARLEAARSTDRLRSALIDSLTHELRTPLTAIRAAATTLMDGYGLDELTRTELATIVDEESARLDALIGEAMEIAEIESDGIRVKPEPLQTAAFLEQAVRRSYAELSQHRVTINVEPDEEPVWFDAHLIGRVLRHLLENAAHHTPANSHIRLTSRRLPYRLEFTVQDDGQGIDPHDLPLIFEKFYRGRNRGISAKGSGMGLAITRALLTAHGGSIEVESALGRGTTFRFWVPIVDRHPGITTHPEEKQSSEFTEAADADPTLRP